MGFGGWGKTWGLLINWKFRFITILLLAVCRATAKYNFWRIERLVDDYHLKVRLFVGLDLKTLRFLVGRILIQLYPASVKLGYIGMAERWVHFDFAQHPVNVFLDVFLYLARSDSDFLQSINSHVELVSHFMHVWESAAPDFAKIFELLTESLNRLSITWKLAIFWKSKPSI